jgi:hypothetical protein
VATVDRGCRAVALRLPDQLLVDGHKEPLLALTQPWIGLGRLGDRHHPLVIITAGRQVSEEPSKGVGPEPQGPLQGAHPLRLRRRLTEEPLRHGRLRYAQRAGEIALGQSAVLPSTLERLPEDLPLLRRCHPRDPVLVGLTCGNKHALSGERKSTL